MNLRLDVPKMSMSKVGNWLIGTAEEPSLLFFASLDLVGSTAAKQPKEGNLDSALTQDWKERFGSIFTSLQALVKEHEVCALHERRLESHTEPARLLKINGDELVFFAKAASRSHALALLLAFRKVTERHNHDEMQRAVEPFGPRPMRIKTTCWIAGFPVNNIRIRTSGERPLMEGVSETERREQYDYIGPSMDMGFRLTKFARPDALVVSADLAWLLLQDLDDNSLEYQVLDRDGLRGIAEGTPYPVIAIKCREAALDSAPWIGQDFLPVSRVILSRDDKIQLLMVCNQLFKDVKQKGFKWFQEPYFADALATSFGKELVVTEFSAPQAHLKYWQDKLLAKQHSDATPLATETAGEVQVPNWENITPANREGESSR